MKHLSFYAFLMLLAVLAACNPRQSREMEAALEQAKAVYADGSLEIEVDTVLFIPGLSEASAYFAGKKQYGKAALAALLNGYSEKDFDKEAAMLSFKEAEHYGELAQDSITQARAEYWIGKLLYYEGMVDAGLIYFKKADLAFGTNFIERSLAQNGQAASFIMLCEYDSAEFCLKTSLLYIQNIQNHHSDEIECKVLNNYAVLYQLRGEYEKGVACLRRIRPKNDGQRLLNNLNLGNAFALSGNADSADYYYEKTKESLENVKAKQETKAAAYKALCELAERKGDWQTALAYRNKYESIIIGLLEARSQKNTYRIQQKYDYVSLSNSMNQSIVTRQRMIIFLCALLAFLAFGLVILQHKLVIKTRQEAKAKERALYYIQKYYESVAKQGETIQKVAIVMNNKGDKALMDKLAKTVFGKKEPWEAFVDVFDTLHPGERQKIEQLYPELNELERKHVLLSYFGVSRQDEALLLKIGIHSVDKLRQSVKGKTTHILG